LSNNFYPLLPNSVLGLRLGSDWAQFHWQSIFYIKAGWSFISARVASC